MNLIDTHTHIYLPEFDNDRDEVICRAAKNNVVKLLMPNIDETSISPMMEAASKYNGICYPMIGLHPTSVKEDFRQKLGLIRDTIDHYKYIAIGEIGIDLYWDKTFINEQKEVMREQLALSIDMNLPAVIHSREAFKEIFEILEEFRGSRLKGVFHAFTGDQEMAKFISRFGFKFGIGGIVTFKNSGLDRVVKEISLENIIIETDSPYLAPAPHRGKRNESSYISLVNDKIAQIKGISSERCAELTTSVARELFNID
ncbi:MAG: TatD family hydrolase [Bacteroidales bacterium]